MQYRVIQNDLCAIWLEPHQNNTSSYVRLNDESMQCEILISSSILYFATSLVRKFLSLIWQRPPLNLGCWWIVCPGALLDVFFTVPPRYCMSRGSVDSSVDYAVPWMISKFHNFIMQRLSWYPKAISGMCWYALVIFAFIGSLCSVSTISDNYLHFSISYQVKCVG